MPTTTALQLLQPPLSAFLLPSASSLQSSHHHCQKTICGGLRRRSLSGLVFVGKEDTQLRVTSTESDDQAAASASADDADDDDDPSPQDLEDVAQIKRVLELLRKNRDMIFSEVKLTIMIEDPREVERRRLLGIDDSEAPTRDDLAAVLEEEQASSEFACSFQLLQPASNRDKRYSFAQLETWFLDVPHYECSTLLHEEGSLLDCVVWWSDNGHGGRWWRDGDHGASGGVVERYWWLWQCWSWWRDGSSGGRGGGVGGEREGFGEEVGWFLWWKVLPTGAMMVNEGKIPKNRVALRMLAEEMAQWPNLEVEVTKKKKKPGKSPYAETTDTGIEPEVAAKRLNIDWDSAADIKETDVSDDAELPSILGYGALYLVTAFPVIIGISVVLILFYNSLQ
ncbi:hypothetical protein RHMOL_Rhmol02G0213900 [Rhododendron molle]|uniref:Uncharacterized protein n=2 Tax=Rhododendron molle TaxID=49168 RepID=A0ACC0PTX8_RHOML|nr:hypothetical protein RHMOL_Rhmol02G0213900 [Rhododendron molle]KAI8568609.1 hypothetical protein RHMOL_Rhmol02G0213900 [Rhododendron molle]